MYLRSKKGQVTVLIMMICSSMVLMMSIFITVVGSKAVDASVESLGRLWASSLLGEYDLNLYERYGLLGYYGVPEEIDAKLDYLASYSFDGKGYISYEGCRSSVAGYGLDNRDELVKQIRAVALTDAVASFSTGGFSGGGSEDYEYPGEISGASITNGRILGSLPSAQGTDDSILDYLDGLLSGIGSIKDAVYSGTDAYIETYYIKNHFGNALRVREDAFLKYEMEYVLAGKKSDRENYYSTRNRIIALREALNYAYINTNERMSEEALLVAELIAPGPGAPAVQQALLAAWAFGESVNDYRLLIHGHPVPYMKEEGSWALKLETILEYSGEGYLYAGNQKGEYYEDYLFTMIFLLGEKTRVLRMMDLIEIDMKKNCYRDFRLADYCTGIDYEIKVNGKSHSFRDYY